jgi:hypothetical protein
MIKNKLYTANKFN